MPHNPGLCGTLDPNDARWGCDLPALHDGPHKWPSARAEPDTLNRFAVTAHQGKIVSFGLAREWTPDEARLLAAWLIVALQMNDGDNGRELEKVGELVRAIERA